MRITVTTILFLIISLVVSYRLNLLANKRLLEDLKEELNKRGR